MGSEMCIRDSSFAIRRWLSCGEGPLAATTAAAAAGRCSFSLIISVLTVVVMVCLLFCLFSLTLALFVAAIILVRRVITRDVGMYLLHVCQLLAFVTIELLNSGVCALQALIILGSCGAVALPPPKRGYLHL